MTAIALNERSTWFPFIGIKEIIPKKRFQQGFDFFTWIIEIYIVFHWNDVRKSRCSMDEIWICQFQFCFFWSLKGGKLVSRRFCRGALEGSIRDGTSVPSFPFRTLLKVSRSSNWNRRDSGRILLWIRRSLYVSYEVIQRVTLLWKLSNFSKVVLFANQTVVPYKIKGLI